MLTHCEKSNLLKAHTDALKKIVQDDLSVKAFFHKLYDTIQEHRHIFTLLNGTVDSFYQEQTNTHLKRQFKNGLRDEIKSQLNNYCSITDLVHDAMEIENFVLTRRNQIICQLCRRMGHSALNCPKINDSAHFKNHTRPYRKKNNSNQPIRLNKPKMLQETALTKPMPIVELQYSKYDCNFTKNKNNIFYNDDENLAINNDSNNPTLRIKASFEPFEKGNKYESEFPLKLTNNPRDSCSIESKHIILNGARNNLTNNDIISKSNDQLKANPQQKRTRIGSGRFYRPDYKSRRKLFTTDGLNEDSPLHYELYEKPLYVNQSSQNLPKIPGNNKSETNVIQLNHFITHENLDAIDDAPTDDILETDSVQETGRTSVLNLNDLTTFCDSRVENFYHNDSIVGTLTFDDIYAPKDESVISNLENGATIKADKYTETTVVQSDSTPTQKYTENDESNDCSNLYMNDHEHSFVSNEDGNNIFMQLHTLKDTKPKDVPKRSESNIELLFNMGSQHLKAAKPPIIKRSRNLDDSNRILNIKHHAIRFDKRFDRYKILEKQTISQVSTVKRDLSK